MLCFFRACIKPSVTSDSSLTGSQINLRAYVRTTNNHNHNHYYKHSRDARTSYQQGLSGAYQSQINLGQTAANNARAPHQQGANPVNFRSAASVLPSGLPPMQPSNQAFLAPNKSAASLQASTASLRASSTGAQIPAATSITSAVGAGNAVNKQVSLTGGASARNTLAASGRQINGRSRLLQPTAASRQRFDGVGQGRAANRPGTSGTTSGTAQNFNQYGRNMQFGFVPGARTRENLGLGR